MDWEQRCIRLCAGMLLFAILLRLWAGGALAPAARALESPEAASFFLYLQTGRVVRYAPADPPPETTAPAPETTAVEFTPEEADFPGIDGAAELLTQPLDLDLTGAGPRVLILHTHTTESFTPTGADYEETSPYRTLDPGHNMIALGEIVAQILQDAGVEVLHDTSFHDYPSYNGSYPHAAAATKEYLEAYPTIELILDLHRDAADTPTGQFATKCSIGGESAAQLMFVLGTDQRLTHPDWERNLSLALKLQVLLERENPGICREISLSKNRYNQHLGKYALLIEIGAAGNTLEQARLAARELGEALAELVLSSED